jgi:hypothetical protein
MAHRLAQESELRGKVTASLAKQKMQSNAQLAPERNGAVLHLGEQTARFLA